VVREAGTAGGWLTEHGEPPPVVQCGDSSAEFGQRPLASQYLTPTHSRFYLLIMYLSIFYISYILHDGSSLLSTRSDGETCNMHVHMAS
jgi:hypothetical protein